MVVLKQDVIDIDVSDDVLSAYSGEVRLGGEAHFGSAPLVDVKGVEVCISEVCVELVQRVVGLG